MNAVRVLVVDDEVPLARIVASYLEHEGYEVVLAHDGLEAVDLAATFRPDVVILDIMLPGLDGMEVCRVLRQLLGLLHRDAYCAGGRGGQGARPGDGG